jgi:hypothetical protein
VVAPARTLRRRDDRVGRFARVRSGPQVRVRGRREHSHGRSRCHDVPRRAGVRGAAPRTGGGPAAGCIHTPASGLGPTKCSGTGVGCPQRGQIHALPRTGTHPAGGRRAGCPPPLTVGSCSAHRLFESAERLQGVSRRLVATARRTFMSAPLSLHSTGTLRLWRTTRTESLSGERPPPARRRSASEDGRRGRLARAPHPVRR